MVPTIILRDGKLFMTAGAPGGSRIPTAVLQVILNVLDFHMNVQDAVDAPRIHHQLLPPDTLFEEPYGTLDPQVRQALVARGYRFENQGWNGDIQVVVIGPGGASAVSDPRGRGVGRVLAAASE